MRRQMQSLSRDTSMAEERRSTVTVAVFLLPPPSGCGWIGGTSHPSARRDRLVQEMTTQRIRYLTARPGPEIGAQEFRVGQRVRLSELGRARTPKARAHTGRVVALPAPSTVEILFDGNKRPTKLHRSYIEIDDR